MAPRDFERAGLLQVFALEEEMRASNLIEGSGSYDGGAVDTRCDEAMRSAYSVQI